MTDSFGIYSMTLINLNVVDYNPKNLKLHSLWNTAGQEQLRDLFIINIVKALERFDGQMLSQICL